jgi:asparaginyl-tRNA synthetase
MTKRFKIDKLLKSDMPMDEVLVKGWVRTKRSAKDFSFVELNDGSCLKNMQIIADSSLDNYDDIGRLTTGSAVAVFGRLAPSPGAGQKWEIHATHIEAISIAPEDYPLQKKRHSDEFLRTIAHLRPRTNKYSAVFRIRSELSYAIHRFFHDRGFRYIHTPILTASDCEGAGELFQVTTLDLENIPSLDGKADYTEDFFGKEAGLTVSGQLSAEMFALALGDVYTFGPTFRAENSNTSRHVAEFWMIEPEMAFCDLEGDMDLAEEMLKYLAGVVRENCAEDIALFAKFVDKELSKTIDNLITSDFERIRYEEAIDILKKSKQPFEYEVAFGKDLQSEHERYITEKYFKKPVIVSNYPKEIKPFYMRMNDDGLTVAAMDILVPRIGEIIGGSQREERLAVLEQRMKEMDLPLTDYWWYLDSRKFGSVPHSGFGLGFERLLMFFTGINNIRDVIPFPRTPKNIEF